jgi:hypothetical protein
MSQTPPPVVPEEPEDEGRPLMFWVKVGGIAFGVAIVIIFAVGLLLAFNDVERAGNFIRVIRDLFIIVLALQSMVIVAALVVLILQLAGLISILQTEIKPVLENLQATLNTAKGTIRFVGDNVAAPVVKAGGFFAGLSVFMREIGGIRRAIRRDENGATPDEE